MNSHGDVGVASIADLVGIPFSTMDCYALTREALQRLRGVTLPENPACLIADGGEAWGTLVPKDEAFRIGDVLEFSGPDGGDSHLAIVVDTIQRKALHSRNGQTPAKQTSIITSIDVLVAAGTLLGVWRAKTPLTDNVGKVAT